MEVFMRKLPLLAMVLGLAFVMGACRNPDYKPDPSVEACNVGGPLGKSERTAAREPNPQAVPGRPPDCRMGPDGVMRRPVT
jgi:hypothetical protein